MQLNGRALRNIKENYIIFGKIYIQLVKNNVKIEIRKKSFILLQSITF